jgi:hypothetical protein
MMQYVPSGRAELRHACRFVKAACCLSGDDGLEQVTLSAGSSYLREAEVRADINSHTDRWMSVFVAYVEFDLDSLMPLISPEISSSIQ